MLWMLEKENPELGEDVVAPTVDEGVLVPKPPNPVKPENGDGLAGSSFVLDTVVVGVEADGGKLNLNPPPAPNEMEGLLASSLALEASSLAFTSSSWPGLVVWQAGHWMVSAACLE